MEQHAYLEPKQELCKELAEGITSQVIYAHNTNVTIEARVGGRMGDMYGRGFQRSPDGKVIYSLQAFRHH
jgi:hypothetical protein